jgi:Ca2+-binding EF-hand superfamily protein
MISILPSNASQIASSLFSKLDTKSQGFIEKSDLQAAFSKLDSSSSSSDTSSVDEIFSSLDSDQDGKITKSEMTTGIENLVGQLNSQLNSSRVQNGMPPPPPPEGYDQGFTKDELSSISSETTDTKLADLMTKLASNFEAADTNQDGKVSAQEAKAYEQQSQASTSSASSSNNEANVLMKIAQLLQAYSSSSSDASSSISVTA